MFIAWSLPLHLAGHHAAVNGGFDYSQNAPIT